MTVHVLAGLRPTPLAGYLAGLGLVRLLGEQADPDVEVWWDGPGLTVDTTLDDVATWLVDAYVPTPVLSPWNEGSGFGEKDRKPKVALAALAALPGHRLSGFRAAVRTATIVAMDYRAGRRTKEQAVRQFRNTCPDELVPWIDASVVLAGTGQPGTGQGADTRAYFPPLLGTGGNDGRLDFSTNFHQRLLDVLATSPAGRSRSLRLARDLLAAGQVEPLLSAAIGQFDPASAGGCNSSPFGAADSLVNPWSFVLMVEGALLFAAGATRRLAHAAGRAAIPYTVEASPDGTTSGADDEATHGEVWAPVWSRPFSYREVRQLFTEARASWRGGQARRAVEFYQAAVTHGVARGVGSFVRYGVHQRNGKSHLAVPLDIVRVRPLPNVRLVAEVEEWVAQVRRGSLSAAVRVAVRRLDAAQMTFARAGAPFELAGLLAALTDLEVVAGRSGRLRGQVWVRRPPAAGEFLAVLAEEESPELRIAAGLASCATVRGKSRDAPPGRSMRELLLPVDPGGAGQPARWRKAAVVPGFGIRPFREVLADVLVWRSRTAAGETGEDGAFRGVPVFRAGLRVPAVDLHDWVTGRLSDRKIEFWLRALLSLRWQGATHRWTAVGQDLIPVPTLGLLHALAEGMPTGSHLSTDQPTASGPKTEAQRLALAPDWANLLRADLPTLTRRVHEGAVRRLRQAGWHAAPTIDAPAVSGVALAAALVPRCAGTARVLRQLAVPLATHDNL